MKKLLQNKKIVMAGVLAGVLCLGAGTTLASSSVTRIHVTTLANGKPLGCVGVSVSKSVTSGDATFSLVANGLTKCKGHNKGEVTLRVKPGKTVVSIMNLPQPPRGGAYIRPADVKVNVVRGRTTNVTVKIPYKPAQ